MVLSLTSFCVVSLFVSLIQAQSYNTRDATLENAINYTAKFAPRQDYSAQPPVDKLDAGKLEQDPFIRTLFQEFLVQYQQLTNQEKTEVPLTTTTTETSFKTANTPFHFFPTSQHFRTASPNVRNPAPTLQKRRLSPRRKINTPLAVRPSFNHVTSTTPFPTRHYDPLKSTTAPASLRQRFFGVTTPNSNKIAIERKTFPLATVTTPTPQLVVEELPLATQPPNLVPKVKIPPRLASVPSKPTISSRVESTKSEFDEEVFRRQAANAKYEFASDIDDEISGNLHQREEVRDGLTVKGRYTYSDGFFKRTVNYEADDKGYRVVKEDVQPLDGPQVNPDGEARVSSYVAGNAVAYQITKDDILKKNQNMIFRAPEAQNTFVGLKMK